MRPLTPLFVLAVMSIWGCVNVHPRYRADDVVWDDTLLGRWQAVDKDGKSISLLIEARAVEVAPDDQRLNPDDSGFGRAASPDAATADPASPGAIRQYLLHYTQPDGPVWTLEGYLLQAGDCRFLAFQRFDPFIDDNAGWVLPVHMLWRVEHTPDTLAFSSPKDAVAWIPAIQWADGADDGGDTPIPRRAPDQSRPGIRVAESLDRVLEYHARHAGDPTFWTADESMRFRRAPDAGR